MKILFTYFFKRLLCLTLFVVVLSQQIFADTNTQKQVDSLKAFVDSGIDYIKQNGVKKAYAEISNPKGKFHHGEFYLYVYNDDGVCLAHGADPKGMVGKNLYTIKDQFGMPYVQMMIELAKSGGGFVSYYSVQPQTRTLQLKTVYVKPIDDETFIGGGLYDFIDVPRSYDVRIAELKGFLNSGIDYIKKYGEKAAYEAFNKSHGQFSEGNFYLFVINYKGVMLANGNDVNHLIGKNIYDLKDEFGTPFVKMFIKTAKLGGGIVGYYWLEPDTGKVKYKTCYVLPIDKDKFIATGFYAE